MANFQGLGMVPRGGLPHGRCFNGLAVGGTQKSPAISYAFPGLGPTAWAFQIKSVPGGGSDLGGPVGPDKARSARGRVLAFRLAFLLACFDALHVELPPFTQRGQRVAQRAAE
jgi:hypothetical protein